MSLSHWLTRTVSRFWAQTWMSRLWPWSLSQGTRPRPGQPPRPSTQVGLEGLENREVPLDVLGLPHGVRVLDIGLNGILVTPGQTSRTVTIYCEPWVKPMEHPIVVLARREGKNTEHAAGPVLLKISR